MPNLAIFGGTFNPVHWGHLLLAEAAFDQFSLDRVIWVPTVRPPHKVQSLLAFEHRLTMVRGAIADHPAFTLFESESQQDTSYAITTLNALQAFEPHADWYWILGNDAFQSLPKWRASQELAAQCTWLVAPRARTTGERRTGTIMQAGADQGAEGGGVKGDGEARNDAGAEEAASPLIAPHASSLTPYPSLHWYRLQMPSVAVSSSLIRQRCCKGRSIRYLVPESVRCYIAEQKLYQMS